MDGMSGVTEEGVERLVVLDAAVQTREHECHDPLHTLNSVGAKGSTAEIDLQYGTKTQQDNRFGT
jgi:hypothetical protein